MSSPLRRALQTAIHSFPTALARLGGNKALVIIPEAREVYLYPADMGSTPEKLASDPEFDGIEFSSLQDKAWMTKVGFYATTDSAIAARARFVRRMLRDRPEKHIVLLTHGNFIRCLLYGRTRGQLLGNGEIRRYTFTSDTDEEATLKELGGIAPENAEEEAKLELARKSFELEIPTRFARRRLSSPSSSN